VTGVQVKDNPITYPSSEVAQDHPDHKGVVISDNGAATLHSHNDDEESSSSSEEDEPQSKADVLAAAGVSIKLEELQMLQAEQAPLELVTEVRHAIRR